MYTAAGQHVHSTRRGKMIHRQLNWHESHKQITEAAICNEQNAKYHTDIPRPIRLRMYCDAAT